MNTDVKMYTDASGRQVEKFNSDNFAVKVISRNNFDVNMIWRLHVATMAGDKIPLGNDTDVDNAIARAKRFIRNGHLNAVIVVECIPTG